jgi:hypothetical protein
MLDSKISIKKTGFTMTSSRYICCSGGILLHLDGVSQE